MKLSNIDHLYPPSLQSILNISEKINATLFPNNFGKQAEWIQQLRYPQMALTAVSKLSSTDVLSHINSPAFSILKNHWENLIPKPIFGALAAVGKHHNSFPTFAAVAHISLPAVFGIDQLNSWNNRIHGLLPDIFREEALDSFEEFQAQFETAGGIAVDSNGPIISEDALIVIRKYLAEVWVAIMAEVGSLKDPRLISRHIKFVFGIVITVCIQNALSPEPATQKDIEQITANQLLLTKAISSKDFQRSFNQDVAQKFDKHKMLMIAGRRSTLYATPKASSNIVGIVHKGAQVIVLDSNKKWWRVSTHEPEEGYSLIGWIPRKTSKLVFPKTSNPE